MPEKLQHPSQSSSLGQQIVDAIIEGKMVSAECGDDKDHPCIMVWSASVYEQIDAIIAGSTPPRANRVGDAVHDVVLGFGRLVFPWTKGRWIMWGRDRRRFGLTWWKGFHNCSATGVQ